MNNMPYLKAVILEGLHKHPLAHFALAHKAVEYIEISGCLFPKGAMVNFMVADMGREEREWQKPAEFLPEHFLPGGDGEGVDVTGSRKIRMMVFGVGRRICARLGVAMLHLEYFVAILVKDVHKMPYLKAVVLEGLRKHLPAHFVLPHTAAEDMDVGGYLIPNDNDLA